VYYLIITIDIVMNSTLIYIQKSTMLGPFRSRFESWLATLPKNGAWPHGCFRFEQIIELSQITIGIVKQVYNICGYRYIFLVLCIKLRRKLKI